MSFYSDGVATSTTTWSATEDAHTEASRGARIFRWVHVRDIISERCSQPFPGRFRARCRPVPRGLPGRRMMSADVRAGVGHPLGDRLVGPGPPSIAHPDRQDRRQRVPAAPRATRTGTRPRPSGRPSGARPAGGIPVPASRASRPPASAAGEDGTAGTAPGEDHDVWRLHDPDGPCLPSHHHDRGVAAQPSLLRAPSSTLQRPCP
jgi:hypothetical protein